MSSERRNWKARASGLSHLMLAAGCAAAVGVGGCGYKAPSLAVAGARVTEVTGEGFAVALTIEATNENDDALPLRRARYRVRVGEQEFRGVRSAETTLRRRGTQRFELPAAFAMPAGGMPVGEVEYSVDCVLTYVTPGALAEVLFDTGVRKPEVRLRERGRMVVEGGSGE